MKKIFTLLFCTAIISSTFAQTGQYNGYNINVNYYAKSSTRQYNDPQNYIDSYRDTVTKEIRK